MDDLQDRLLARAVTVEESDPDLAGLLREAADGLVDRIAIDVGEEQPCIIDGELATFVYQQAVERYINDALRHHIDRIESE